MFVLYCIFPVLYLSCELERFLKQRETLVNLRRDNPGVRIRSSDQLGPRVSAV